MLTSCFLASITFLSATFVCTVLISSSCFFGFGEFSRESFLSKSAGLKPELIRPPAKGVGIKPLPWFGLASRRLDSAKPETKRFMGRPLRLPPPCDFFKPPPGAAAFVAVTVDSCFISSVVDERVGVADSVVCFLVGGGLVSGSSSEDSWPGISHFPLSLSKTKAFSLPGSISVGLSPLANIPLKRPNNPLLTFSGGTLPELVLLPRKRERTLPLLPCDSVRLLSFPSRLSLLLDRPLL
mmetsp:Transcript_60750/g.69423  ORF Transcript_60750/g.69423 Transcript_60750/m.69423 type:complete len:239 (-) Transcript_60750:333-1049(-)